MADHDYTSEIWKTIPFAPSYAVSSFGRVRRIAGGQGARAGLLLKPIQTDRYPAVNLYTRGVGAEHCHIHRVVAITFLGEPPTNRHQVAHWDGDPHNNRLENLRWATAKENGGSDVIRHGTRRGERNGTGKFTDE